MKPSSQTTPRPAPSAPARAAPAASDSLPVPRGAVRILGRLLVMSQGNPKEAAELARRFARGTDDARYALLAGILDEVTADCADLLKARAGASLAAADATGVPA